ncbi:MAG: fatty acid desaturase [Nannocystaceae bacterium]|nr:fatty acid desaturase [bacterium]
MDVRAGKALILATKEFEQESVARSWFEITSTFVAYGAAIAALVAADAWALRVGFAFIAGLIQFRMFSLFHAHLHKALLWRSKPARWLFAVLGVLILVPRSVWLQTHNFHHINNGKIAWTSIGSYPVWTRERYEAATPRERRRYLMSRHVLKMVLGYVFIGIGGMCINAFLRTPKKNWLGPVALLLHVAIFSGLAAAMGLASATLVLIVPCAVNHAVASYLFYAQHNFPGTVFFDSKEWNYGSAAVQGSSYFRMGPVMRWMTADIGYHHVHHLNHKIPTYRSAEAMAAMPELQSPAVTSWRLRDVLACLRLTVWNPATRAMEPLLADDGAVEGLREAS